MKRQHGYSAILNYQTLNALKERISAKGLRYVFHYSSHSETEENLAKKKVLVSPQRLNQQLTGIDDKFTTFSLKLKSLLKS